MGLSDCTLVRAAAGTAARRAGAAAAGECRRLARLAARDCSENREQSPSPRRAALRAIDRLVGALHAHQALEAFVTAPTGELIQWHGTLPSRSRTVHSTDRAPARSMHAAGERPTLSLSLPQKGGRELVRYDGSESTTDHPPATLSVCGARTGVGHHHSPSPNPATKLSRWIGSTPRSRRIGLPRRSQPRPVACASAGALRRWRGQ